MDIVENTFSKHQETLKFEMTKQKESLSFHVPPPELPEQWMMGVTSLEVFNPVYNITENNNKHKILLKDEQLKSLNIDTQLVMNVEYSIQTSSNIEKADKLIIDSYSKSKTLIRKDFDYLKKIIDQNNLDKDNINICEFAIEDDFFEI